MKNNVIRLTESQLHNVIKDCVEQIVREGKLKKKDPLHYWARKTKCPKCGGEGNPFYGGLCPDCAKGENIANQRKL